MPLSTEQVATCGEIATSLRSVADTLDGGWPITLTAEEQEEGLDPHARATFEIKAERDGPADGPDELSVELEWDEHGDAELSIE